MVREDKKSEWRHREYLINVNFKDKNPQSVTSEATYVKIRRFTNNNRLKK